MSEISIGLSTEEVNDRISKGLNNGRMDVSTKSIGQILKTNFFTLFNALNFILVILICTLGKAPAQALFAGPAIINLFIGLFQEIRAKRTIDKLSLISAPQATVIRNGHADNIAVSDIVIDDYMILDAGRQVCADSDVIEGSCEVNESLLTGESDPVVKKEGDELLSGSFIISGKITARVKRVGMDNYASKISAGAKYIKQTNSEILRGLRAVIRLMSIVVIPLGLLLFLKQLLIRSTPVSNATVMMVSSMSSMIPQGLIALTSVVFAVGVIRLSKHKTLAQDLYCIETLARVDVLCLDKTGTITEGSMQVDKIVLKSDCTAEDADNAMVMLTSVLPDSNPTFNAIKSYLNKTIDISPSYIIPFSSQRKWSGVAFLNEGTFIMGAPEFVLRGKVEEYREELNEYSKEGERVLVLAKSPEVISEKELPDNLTAMAFILIGDKIRKEAPETLRFFAEQNVDIRIISGDNPVTVSAIAKKAGLMDCEYIDMSTVKTIEELIEASRKYKVFGRVSPEQKLKLVKALKADGHTVAMTGDGVNDVLALKEADCSIAVAEGSDAARNVAQLVLLDSNFASLPRIVAEGRRSINNLQRSASLFLVKTIYSALLTMFFLFFGDYPFEPTNLTLVASATIGIPAFLLALEPNNERIKGKFLHNTIRKSLPGALAIVLNIALLEIISRFVHVTADELSTVSVILLGAGTFTVFFRVCLPMDLKHGIIFFGMLITFFLGWGIFPRLFSMTPMSQITSHMIFLTLPLLATTIPLLLLMTWSLNKFFANKELGILNKLKLEQ
ncbi:MAG: HAD family hydrolase [Clostridia bacterium]|nr:HAD family hydrolase [Clostridia bacterium]